MLLILLLLVIIGAVVFMRKVKQSARKAIKRDVNQLYGIDYEGEAEDKNPRSSLAEESYDYMGN